MARDVNVILSNHRRTTNVSFQRFVADYDITYTNDDGTPGEKAGTLTFPDIATNIALDPQMVRDDIEALLLKWGRIILGIDSGQ